METNQLIRCEMFLPSIYILNMLPQAHYTEHSVTHLLYEETKVYLSQLLHIPLFSLILIGTTDSLLHGSSDMVLTEAPTPSTAPKETKKIKAKGM